MTHIRQQSKQQKSPPSNAPTTLTDSKIDQSDYSQPDINQLGNKIQLSAGPPPLQNPENILQLQRTIGNQAVLQLFRQPDASLASSAPETFGGLITQKTAVPSVQIQDKENQQNHLVQREGGDSATKKKSDPFSNNQANTSGSTSASIDAGADAQTVEDVGADYTESLDMLKGLRVANARVVMRELIRMIEAMVSGQEADKVKHEIVKSRLNILKGVFSRRIASLTETNSAAKDSLQKADGLMGTMHHDDARTHIADANYALAATAKTISSSAEAAVALKRIYADKSSKSLRPQAENVGDLKAKAEQLIAMGDKSEIASSWAMSHFDKAVHIYDLRETDKDIPTIAYAADVALTDTEFEAGDSMKPDGFVDPNADANGGVSGEADADVKPEVGSDGSGGNNSLNSNDAGQAQEARLSDSEIPGFKADVGDVAASVTVGSINISLGKVIDWIDYLGLIKGGKLIKAIYDFRAKRNLLNALKAGKSVTDEKLDAFGSVDSDADADSATDDLKANQTFAYGAAKVARALRSAVVSALNAVAGIISKIILISSGGFATPASFFIGAAASMQKLASHTFRAGKALYKIIKGTRGVNRSENARNLVDLASNDHKETITYLNRIDAFDRFKKALSADDRAMYDNYDMATESQMVEHIIDNGHRDILEDILAKDLKSNT